MAAVAATTDMAGAVRPPLGGAGGGGSHHHRHGWGRQAAVRRELVAAVAATTFGVGPPSRFLRFSKESNCINRWTRATQGDLVCLHAVSC